jgi:hypothetical protein
MDELKQVCGKAESEVLRKKAQTRRLLINGQTHLSQILNKPVF